MFTQLKREEGSKKRDILGLSLMTGEKELVPEFTPLLPLESKRRTRAHCEFLSSEGLRIPVQV